MLERRPQTGDIPASEARRVILRADVVAITGTVLRFVSEGAVFSELHGRGVQFLTMSKERS